MPSAAFNASRYGKGKVVDDVLVVQTDTSGKQRSWQVDARPQAPPVVVHTVKRSWQLASDEQTSGESAAGAA
jgi:hypothetical protein